MMVRSKKVTTLLCFFLGGFGIHKFYLGNWVMGIIYLVTGGLLGIGPIVDLFNIYLGNTRTQDGKELVKDCGDKLPLVLMGILILLWVFSLIRCILNILGNIVHSVFMVAVV